MRFILILAILLAFPFAEIWLLIVLGDRYGWYLLAYLLLMALLGWRLLQAEKLFLFARILQSLQQGNAPASALFGSAKNLVAGVLLIIPGVISDALALILLLLPSSAPPVSARTAAANDDVIEGEFRRED